MAIIFSRYSFVFFLLPRLYPSQLSEWLWLNDWLKLQEIKLRRAPTGTSGMLFVAKSQTELQPEWGGGAAQDLPQRQVIHHQWQRIGCSWPAAANCEHQMNPEQTVWTVYVGVSSLTPATTLGIKGEVCLFLHIKSYNRIFTIIYNVLRHY